MSHLLNTVNSNEPNRTGEITDSSIAGSFQFLLVGNMKGFTPNQTITSYPRNINVNDAYLFPYKSADTDYFFNNITGATINTYNTNYLEDLTLPEGSYIAITHIRHYYIGGAYRVRLEFYDITGAARLSGMGEYGYQANWSYNNSKLPIVSRFTLSTSSNVKVNISTRTNTNVSSSMLFWSLMLIKES